MSPVGAEPGCACSRSATTAVERKAAITRSAPAADCDDQRGTRQPVRHPSPEVVSRLERAGSRMFRTDVDGAIAVETDGVSVRVSTVVGSVVFGDHGCSRGTPSGWQSRFK